MAAGKGTRLKSKHPKVLHRAAGKPLLEYVVAAASQVVPVSDIYVIIGHEAERVQEAVGSTGVNFVRQLEQLGTGHAILTARSALENYDFVLVLSGDVPLIRPETIQRVREFHLAAQAAMTILTAEPPDPFGYGRIVRKSRSAKTRSAGFLARTSQHEVAAIVEQKALTQSQLGIREINSGIYAFCTQPLFSNIKQLTTDNPHHEFYLTDMASILVRAGEKVVALKSQDPQEVLGVNTRHELADLDARLRRRKCEELMQAGVTIFRPETCVIDADVCIEPDTIIEPFVQVLGRSRIGPDCHIRSYSVIENCELGAGVLVRPGCIMQDSRVASGALLGPYCHLRPGSEIGEGAHVGNFVETKKTRLGKGSKANHLTYLGDSSIGENVNVGAGTITCNYDGVQKHRTVIEDDAFIGSDSILVAPVRIGRGAYVAAASCITEDVPAYALALGRARQTNKENWAKQRREQMAAAKKTS
ncbi:MAG: bifunctional UDP-N-acetylglucosamine diphosphorylase/glucosamine-1-phosphate N-acetyltransferase GlmU [Terriglobales bacterium]